MGTYQLKLLSKGKYIYGPDGDNNIPLAPRVTSTGGITAIHPSGFEGSLGYRYIGSRPANESNTVVAEGYTFNCNFARKFVSALIILSPT